MEVTVMSVGIANSIVVVVLYVVPYRRWQGAGEVKES